jgi:hypothetical protein
VMQTLLNLFVSLTLRRRQMMLCMRWSWKKSWGRLVRLMVRFRGLFGWILITGCLCWPIFAVFLLAKPLFIASHVTNHVWLRDQSRLATWQQLLTAWGLCFFTVDIFAT